MPCVHLLTHGVKHTRQQARQACCLLYSIIPKQTRNQPYCSIRSSPKLLLLLAASSLVHCFCHLWLPAAAAGTAAPAGSRDDVVCNAASIAGCRLRPVLLLLLRHDHMLWLLLRLR